MQHHTLKRRTPNKRKVQVGRGGTRGKTSGKGTKGQNARSGRKKRPEMRDIIKRLPKLRGRGISSLKSIQGTTVAVNLVEIEKAFKAGEIVSPKTLTDKNIVEKKSGMYPRVKILGNGELTLKLTFSACDVSESAKKKIIDLGGVIR